VGIASDIIVFRFDFADMQWMFSHEPLLSELLHPCSLGSYHLINPVHVKYWEVLFRFPHYQANWITSDLPSTDKKSLGCSFERYRLISPATCTVFCVRILECSRFG